MKFNYQSEKRKFERRWKQYEMECRNAGMSEEAIAELREYDMEAFRKERIYCMHNQYINEDELELKQEDSYFETKRYDWINHIEDEELSKAIKKMENEKIELLTQYAFEEYTQKEIAKYFGISRSSVADRISVIKKKLKK